MARLFSQSWFRIVAIPFLLTFGLLACARYYRISNLRDLRTVWAMSRECHPVWKELNRGRIHAGRDIEEVIAQTNPARVERIGRFVWLSYHNDGRGLCFTDVQIVATDGKVTTAVALSCTWHRVFIDASTKEDVEASWNARKAANAGRVLAAVTLWN